MVVNCDDARGGIFDSDIAAQKAAGDEILGVADRPAIFEARREIGEAAAINADLAAAVEGAAFGGDVDDAGRVQAVLRGQRAVDHRDIADQAAVEHLAEAGNAVWQQHAVDPVLHVGVFVAQMQRAAGRRILRKSGRLQQNFFDRSVVALR